ncbi:MAG TPA: hypothetical protein VD978_25870 [Azospirillum sp.]|nr:hypothetical protein [Azospirillum sp.]
MDLQYAPAMLDKPRHDEMQARIAHALATSVRDAAGQGAIGHAFIER